jgi:CheY-like chemotaxis protein
MTSPAPRVLLVDDDPRVIGLLRDYFAADGYEVELALHGGDALTLVQHEPPDVVLLDIEMPGLDGFEVLARLRAALPNVPVIVVTASTEATVATRALEGGAASFVTKPFDLARLGAAVRAAVAARPA